MPAQIAPAPTFETISGNELATLIVMTLNLEIIPQAIDPVARFLGTGSGSIRSTCWRSFCRYLRIWDRSSRRDCEAFVSLNALTAHVNRHRTK